MKDSQGNYYVMYMEHWYKLTPDGHIYRAVVPGSLDLDWNEVAVLPETP